MEVTWTAGRAQVKDSGLMEEMVVCDTQIFSLRWMTGVALRHSITFASSNAHPPLPQQQQQPHQQQQPLQLPPPLLLLLLQLTVRIK